MGYTQDGGTHYIPYSGHARVSYPASQTGGSTSVSYSGQVAVNIQVYVDSDPVENSVGNCKHQLDLLTGTLVATEAAQVKSIHENAQQIAKSFTDGFFSVVRSNLTQCIAENRTVADSRVMKLLQMSAAIQQKTAQMQQDFHRIADRYTQVFDDLDREASRRIKAIDAAVFGFAAQIDSQTSRPIRSALSADAVLGATEQLEATNTLVAAGVRQRTHSLLQRAHAYLTTHKSLGLVLNKVLRPEKLTDETLHFLPVMQVITDDPQQGVHEEIFAPIAGPCLPDSAALTDNGAVFRLADGWGPMDDETREKISKLLLERVSGLHGEEGSHASRVARQIWALWQQSPPEMLQRLQTGEAQAR